jgi:hypothetical protein
MQDPLHLCTEESSEAWETYSFTQNLVQMHKTDPQHPKRIILKSFCTFSMSKDKITEFLTNNDQLKNAFEDCKELDPNSGRLIFRIRLPTPLGVSKRDAVVEVIKPQDLSIKQIPLLFRQVPDDQYRESNQDGVIRVQVHYMGFIVEEVSMFLTKFWFLCDIDPLGTLPNAVVEYMKKYMSLIPRKIKNFIKGKANT